MLNTKSESAEADRTMHYKEAKKQFIKESLKENLQYGF